MIPLATSLEHAAAAGLTGAGRIAVIVAAGQPGLTENEKDALARAAPYYLLAILVLILAVCIVTFMSEKTIARLPEWALLVIVGVSLTLVVFELVTQVFFVAVAALFGTVLAAVVFIFRVVGPFVGQVGDWIAGHGRRVARDGDDQGGGQAVDVAQAESRRRGADLEHALAALRAEHDDAGGAGDAGAR